MLIEFLQDMGLSDKQAKIYLSSLQLGSQPVSVIAQKAGINRSTAYVVFDELKKKGLVSQYTYSGIKYFSVVSPENLITYLDRLERKVHKSKEDLKEMIPLFHNLLNPNVSKPKVMFFEGVEGISSVYQQLFEEKEIFAYASLQHVFSFFPENTGLFKEAVKKNNIVLWEILEDSKVDRSYATVPFNKTHKVKFIPKSLKFSIDYIIFGNKVAIMTFTERPMCVVIENKDLAETQRCIFKLCWNGLK